MASEAQIRANRINARKSTGPRTEAGKLACRGNALVHGLAGAGVVLPEDLRREAEARAEQWAGVMAPENPMEAWLVGRAAAQSVRLDRAGRHEAAALSARLRHAEDDRRAARRQQVEAIVTDLETAYDPRPLVSRLLDTSDGCAFMIGEWSELAKVLDQTARWTVPQRARAITLLGERRTNDDPGPRTLDLLRWVKALEPDPRLDALLDVADLAPEVEARVDAYVAANDEARLALGRFVAEEIEALGVIRERLEAEHDAPDLAEAADLALFDPEADPPLRRYEAAISRELYKALDAFNKARKSAGVGRASEGNRETCRGGTGRVGSKAVAAETGPPEPFPHPARLREALPPSPPSSAPNGPNPGVPAEERFAAGGPSRRPEDASHDQETGEDGSPGPIVGLREGPA